MRTIALALAVFGVAAPTSAAEIYKLNSTAKAGKERPVAWYFRNLRTNCETAGLPELDLNIPPEGGTVCMRLEMRPVRNIWYGGNQHCIGTKVLGVRVIYIPFGSFAGLDSMQFTVKMAPPVTRTYESKISVGAGEATAVGASSAPSEPQKAGPMPTCPALVS
jgi:hypothetical protein